MDGDKKINRIYIITGILLALTSCVVQKPTGIPLFERTTDSLLFTVDSVSIQPVELGEDSITTFADDLINNLPDSLADIELTGIEEVIPDSGIHQQNQSEFSHPIDMQLFLLQDSGLTLNQIDPGNTPLDSSVFLKFSNKIDSILEIQKLILYRFDSVQRLYSLHILDTRPAYFKQDTIVIKNEIHLSGDGFSLNKRQDSVEQFTDQQSSTNTDKIKFLQSEIEKLKSEVSRNSQQTTETKKIVTQDVIGTVLLTSQADPYDESRILIAKDDSIRLLLSENQTLRDLFLIKSTSMDTDKKVNKAEATITGIQKPVPTDTDTINHLAGQSLQSRIDSLPQEQFSKDSITDQIPGKDTISLPVIDASADFYVIINKEQKARKDSSNVTGATDTIEITDLSGPDSNVIKPAVEEAEIIPLPFENIPSPAEEDQSVMLKVATDTLLSAYYDSGKFDALNEEQLLKSIVQLNNNKKVVRILLSSFTDISGSAEINQVFSEKRANLIQEKLVSIGIPRQNIFIQYFGSKYASASIIEQDRRVEVLIKFEEL